MPMQVELVSPEKILWSGEADMVITRTVGGGDIAFLPGHAPFVGALGIGAMTIRPTDGKDEHVAVHGGFVEVSGNPERGTTVSSRAAPVGAWSVSNASKSRTGAGRRISIEPPTVPPASRTPAAAAVCRYSCSTEV